MIADGRTRMKINDLDIKYVGNLEKIPDFNRNFTQFVRKKNSPTIKEIIIGLNKNDNEISNVIFNDF